MDISSIKIERFKRIGSLELGLKQINLLIGGNNSGKSSFLQGVHFSITTMQSALMAGGTWPVSTLAPDQLVYKPSNDPILLNNNSAMTQTSGPSFTFQYTIGVGAETSEFVLGIKRGKNANMSVSVDPKSPFFTRAADHTRPISIFVPGLAGVALREEKRTDAIITTGIAQGDSNLYLRNVLLRIIQNTAKLDSFHQIIGQIFPGLIISTNYDETRNQYIDINVRIDGKNLPLEMLGTGCLQAIQLVAYTTMYNPTLLLLDEPDSHLHPSNQRLLASTLVSISFATGTKVIISTHSRHMFDALADSEYCKVVWLKDGKEQAVSDVSDLSLLLDLGALDSFETFASPKNKVVVLTEDTKSQKLKNLLEANGFVPGEYFMQALHGVDNIQSAYPVAEFFSKLGANTHVLIHRDGDALLEAEKAWIIDKANKNLPPRSELFITPLTDVEHQFCTPEHISAALGISKEDAKRFVTDAIAKNNARLSVYFANKRQNAKDRVLKAYDKAKSASDLVKDTIPFEYSKGKMLFGQIVEDLNAAGHQGNKLMIAKSAALEIDALQKFAAIAWGAAETHVAQVAEVQAQDTSGFNPEPEALA